MGLNRLAEELEHHDRIALDSSVFIYQLEAHPHYLPLTETVFSWLERRERSAVASTITMAELLVVPYRRKDQQKVDEFFALLSTYPGIEWIAPDLQIADIAARLRAQYRLKTPDALLAATAEVESATAIVTNDYDFRVLQTPAVLILDDMM